MLPSRQAASATNFPAAGESCRYDGCTDRGDCSGAFGVDEEHFHPITATNATDDAESHEVTALRELIQRQKEDLEMAAMIGQGLLDSTEELSAKLEVTNTDVLFSLLYRICHRVASFARRRILSSRTDSSLGKVV